MRDDFEIMSRSAQRDDAIETAANKGEYSVTLKLFPSEVKRLRNKGFTVKRDEDAENRKNELPSKVSWYFEEVFVSFRNFAETDLLGYIMDEEDPELPDGLNTAQKRCLIASRIKYWQTDDND